MNKKYIVALITILLTSFLIQGCAIEKENNQEENGNEKDISFQYQESKIDLPEEVTDVTGIAVLGEDEILLVGGKEDNSDSIVWFRDSTNQWKKQLDINEILNERGISYSENVNTSISELGQIVVSVVENNRMNVIILNKDGSIVQENVTEFSDFEEGVPTSFKMLDDDTFLISDQDGQLYLYQIDKNKVISLNAEGEYNYAVDFLDKEIYALTTNGLKIINTNNVKEVKSQDLTQQVENKIQENQSSNIAIDITEEDEEKYMIFADNCEISKLNGKEEVRLVDGNKTVLGDINYVIQKIIYGQNSIFALVLNEENNAFVPELYQYCYDETLEKTEQEIRIYCLEENIDDLEQVVNAYQRQNPNINVKVETGLYGDSITVSDAIKQLNTEIAAGNGPDILILDGMDVENYIEKNLLIDISECLDKVSGEEELFQNITDLYRDGDAIYAVSGRFSPMYTASMEKDIPSNPKEILEYMESLSLEKDEKPVFSDFSYNQIVSILYRTNLSTLDKEKLVEGNPCKEFYSAIKKIYEMVDMSEVEANEAKQLKYIENTIWGYEDFNLVASDEIKIAIDYFSSVDSVYAATGLKKEEKLEFKYLENDSKEYFYVPGMIMGINAKSRNVEAAKEFIAFALSEDAQSGSLWNGLPVNKSAWKDILQSMEKEKYTTEIDPHNSSSYKGKSITIMLNPFTEDEIETLIKDYENFKVPVKDECNIRNIIMEQADDLVMNKIDEEKATENAKNRINIYLRE